MAKIIIILVVLVIGLVGGFVLNNQQVLSPANNFDIGNVIISGNEILDFSNQGLNRIPENIFNQTDLIELNVSNNNLTGAIQAEIRQLKNLKVLNASRNQMTGVPAEVGQLQNLEILDLSYNQITGLPQELGNLKKLKTLNLSGNSYSQQDLDKIRANLPNTNFILN